MKSTLLILLITWVFSSCIFKSTQETKAEKRATKYIDSINHHQNYTNLSFSNLHPIYYDYENDANYGRFKNDSLKVDSIKRHFKPRLRGWVIYVKYNESNNNGNPYKHRYMIGMDTNFKNCVGVEIGELKFR